MANPALNENFNENEIKVLKTEFVSAGAAGAATATATVAGTVKKAATVAAAAVPFANLTDAANKVNEILTSLKAAGVMA